MCVLYIFFSGVPLLDGGTVRLPQLIGLSRAMDMILTGRPVDAKEAFSFGKYTWYSLLMLCLIIGLSAY